MESDSIENLKKSILKEKTPLNIFNYYLYERNGKKNVKVGERFPRPFQRKIERKRFCHLFYAGFGGEVMLRDENSGEAINCFLFVAKQFKITYREAIIKIANDFKISIPADILLYKNQHNENQ